MSTDHPSKGKRTPGPGAGSSSTTSEGNRNAKLDQLEPDRVDNGQSVLTSNQGVRITDNQNSLKAGPRGPSLLEDFILREKLTHFDHERIPERAVHARGEAAHGYFQVYEPLPWLTKAKFLQDPQAKTPVFVRFSTVAGSRGSADTVRDARGFAVKFYTEEGNYDLVGNNIPVFFIQDAIKFPDLVHSVKPEPHHDMPQASGAHDTFWDFIVSTPETTHMVMWLMSDRAIPRSHRMMEGFGVHTFRFVNADGVSRFVKFHWKPLLGVHGLAWDEAQKIAGKDPDFHRRDLWEAIELGQYPEWELGVQIIEEADVNKFDFDLLDPTKLVPEELVPVRRIGRMTLNRNPDNFFAETEQVAFHPGHVVPGIDFSDDPLLQGRLFSYLDTQLTRLGGPNFHQLPINRPLCPVRNHQRDGMHQQQIHKGRVAYDRNTLANGYPIEAMPNNGGFVSYPEKISDKKTRQRSLSFSDHYSQATMFWKSLSAPEQDHVVEAFGFELSKVETPALRQKMVSQLRQVDETLAARVAAGLGLTPRPADEKPPVPKSPEIPASPALSMANTVTDGIRSRRVALLAADGVDRRSLEAIKAAIQDAGGVVRVVAPHLGELRAEDGGAVPVDHTLKSMPSVMFDAVFVPAGEASVSGLSGSGEARHFLLEAYKHCKPLAAAGHGAGLLRRLGLLPEAEGEALPDGVLIWEDLGSVDRLGPRFVEAVARHRYWNRAGIDAIAA